MEQHALRRTLTRSHAYVASVTRDTTVRQVIANTFSVIYRPPMCAMTFIASLCKMFDRVVNVEYKYTNILLLFKKIKIMKSEDKIVIRIYSL